MMHLRRPLGGLLSSSLASSLPCWPSSSCGWTSSSAGRCTTVSSSTRLGAALVPACWLWTLCRTGPGRRSCESFYLMLDMSAGPADNEEASLKAYLLLQAAERVLRLVLWHHWVILVSLPGFLYILEYPVLHALSHKGAAHLTGSVTRCASSFAQVRSERCDDHRPLCRFEATSVPESPTPRGSAYLCRCVPCLCC